MTDEQISSELKKLKLENRRLKLVIKILSARLTEGELTWYELKQLFADAGLDK